jgi:hypothetical protein
MADDESTESIGAYLGVQVHDEEHEHNEYHDHVDYVGASLVAARLCLGCGAYVAGSHLVLHQRFHDRVQEALVRAAGSDAATSEQAALF